MEHAECRVLQSKNIEPAGQREGTPILIVAIMVVMMLVMVMMARHHAAHHALMMVMMVMIMILRDLHAGARVRLFGRLRARLRIKGFQQRSGIWNWGEKITERTRLENLGGIWSGWRGSLCAPG
jgi:hypothetical protein